jgi:hypothetical protein
LTTYTPLTLFQVAVFSPTAHRQYAYRMTQHRAIVQLYNWPKNVQ